MGNLFSQIFETYYKYRKILVIIPILCAVFGILMLNNVKLGIDLEGGAFIKVSGTEFSEELKKVFPDARITKLSSNTIIEIPYYELKNKNLEDEKKLRDFLKKYIYSDFDVYIVNKSLANELKNRAITYLIISSILIGMVLFVGLRNVKPVVAMVISLIFDTLMVLAGCAVFNIPISIDTLVMILIQAGYSIDTDVVMASYILTHGFKKGLKRGAEIALTMSATSLIAMISIAVLGFILGNVTIFRLGAVLVFGLIADLIVTWLLNPNLLEVILNDISRKHN